MEQINKGVQILLERMDSNPEEFISGGNFDYPGTWAKVITGVHHRVHKIVNKIGEPHSLDELSYLSDEEILALDGKLRDIRREGFTKEVMSKLLAGADDGNYHAFAQIQGGAPKTNPYYDIQKQVHYSQEDIQADIEAKRLLYEQQKRYMERILDKAEVKTTHVFGNGK